MLILLMQALLAHPLNALNRLDELNASVQGRFFGGRCKYVFLLIEKAREQVRAHYCEYERRGAHE